jgi:hypothetical protein
MKEAAMAPMRAIIEQTLNLFYKKLKSCKHQKITPVAIFRITVGNSSGVIVYRVA